MAVTYTVMSVDPNDGHFVIAGTATAVYNRPGAFADLVSFDTRDLLPGSEDALSNLYFVEYVDGAPTGAIQFVPAGPPGQTAGPEQLLIEHLGDGTYRYDWSGKVNGSSGSFGFACFVTGTRIATADGPRAVEDLAVGDRILGADGAAPSIVWIGHRRARDAAIIRFRPFSLPVGPDRDLFVSADHAMFLDGVLVPAGLLVNGDTVTREHRDAVTFWHVELETHGILMAEGAPAESYLDTGNRRQYANCPLAYDPVSATRDPCAEMVLAGERLERARRLVRVSESA